jgi:hypothetical protein
LLAELNARKYFDQIAADSSRRKKIGAPLVGYSAGRPYRDHVVREPREIEGFVRRRYTDCAARRASG